MRERKRRYLGGSDKNFRDRLVFVGIYYASTFFSKKLLTFPKKLAEILLILSFAVRARFGITCRSLQNDKI